MRSITFLILALSVFYTTTITAQQHYQWNNIAFTLEDHYEVVLQEEAAFAAIGDGLEISVAAFENADIDVEDITALTVEMALEENLEAVDDADVIELNGLVGAYVEGYKNGDRVFCMGMINPQTNGNFFVMITFGDVDEWAEDAAINILNSFRHSR